MRRGPRLHQHYNRRTHHFERYDTEPDGGPTGGGSLPAGGEHAAAPATDPAPAPAAEPAAPDYSGSLYDIATAHAGQADDEEGGQASAPADPAAASGEPGAEPAAEPGKQPEAADLDKLLTDAFGDIMSVKPEDIPEPLRPLLKSMQADYTRKTMAAAEAAKRTAAANGDEAGVAALTDLIAKQTAALEALASSRTPQGQAEPDEPAPTRPVGLPEEVAYAGLGPKLDIAQVVDQGDPALLEKYIEQRATAIGRQIVAEFAQQVVVPSIQQVRGMFTEREQQEAAAEATRFMEGNPDLKAHGAEIAALLQTGKSLDEAAAMVRAYVNRENDLAQATALGQRIGAQRRAAVETAEEQFSVPSTSTAPSNAPTFTPEMDLAEIARQAVAHEEGRA